MKMNTTNLFKAFGAKWLLWAATLIFFGTASVQEAQAQLNTDASGTLLAIGSYSNADIHIATDVGPGGQFCAAWRVENTLYVATWDGSSWDMHNTTSAGLYSANTMFDDNLNLEVDSAGVFHITVGWKDNTVGTNGRDHYGIGYYRYDGNWTYDIVYMPTDERFLTKNTSIALSPVGNPEIAYTAYRAGASEYRKVNHAVWNGSGWSIQALDSVQNGSGILEEANISIDANGKRHIIYQKQTFNALNQHYITDQSGSWNMTTIASGSGSVEYGSYATIVVDQSNNPFVVSSKYENNGSTYLYSTPLYSNTGSGWNLDMTIPTESVYPRMAINDLDNKVIAYSLNNSTLALSYEDNGSWTTDTITAAPYVTVRRDVAIKDNNEILVVYKTNNSISYLLMGPPAANTAPVFSSTSWSLNAIEEDETNPTPYSVSSLLGSNATDAEGDSIGIAVVGESGDGTWQFSANGTNWYGMDYLSPGGAAVSDTNAKLLANNVLVRFLPSTNWNGTASLSFRAWDQTTGSNLAFVNATSNGGPTTFSNSVASSSITVNAVNDAPEVILPNSSYVLNFGGANEYVDLPDLNISGSQLTVEAWIYVDNANKTWSRVIDFGNGPNNDNIIFGFESSSGRLFAEIYNGSTSQKVIAPSAFPENQWVHVACVWNGATATIYQDGNPIATGAQELINNVTRTKNYIGKSNWADDYYDGRMMDIRVWTTARTQSEIQNDMDKLLNGNETDLMLYYKAVEGGVTYLPEYTAENDYGSFRGVNWVTQTVPVVSVSTPVNTPIAIPGITVSDVDATGIVTGGVSAIYGKVAINETISGGVTSVNCFYNPDSMSVFIVDGTVNQMNATVSTHGGITYIPDLNFTGMGILQVAISDRGGTGSGGNKNSFANLYINVIPDTNSAPVFSNQTMSIDENSTNGSLVDVFGATDDNLADVLTYTILSGNTNNAFTVSNDSLLVNNQSVLNYELGNNTYTLTVRVSDGTASDTATVTVNVLDVNEAPTVVNANLNIVEDQTTRLGYTIGIDMFSDADGDTIQEFQITTLPVNGQLSIGGNPVAINTPYDLMDLISLNYTPTNNFFGSDSVIIRVSDGQYYATGNGTISISISSVNDAPVVQNVYATVLEDVSTSVYSFMTSATFSDVEDTLPALLRIVTLPANGVIDYHGTPVGAGDTFTVTDAQNLSYTSNLNYNGPDAFTFNFSDGTDFAASAATAYLTVQAVGDAPTDINLSPDSVDENLTAGTVVGTLSATDIEVGDTHTYQIVNNAGYFVISGDQVLTNSVLNYELQNSYDINVIASDSYGTTFTKTLTISINDVNDAPTDITLSNNRVDETMTINSMVGSLFADDEDTYYTHTYTLVSGAGDEDNASFVINNNILQSNTSFDYSVQQQYNIRIRVTDDQGADYEKTFTIFVNDIGVTPTDISLVASEVLENEPAGTVVGMLSSTDADLGDTHSYALVSGAGDAGNAFFTVNGNLLETTTSFDYESLTSTTVRVRSTDSYNLSFEKVITINVLDENEAILSVGLSNTLVAENMPSGTTVGVLSSVDTDVNDSHTYALVTGNGDSGNPYFRITGSTLYTNAVFDYETQDTYSIRLRSTDTQGNTLDQNFTINIADANDAPTDVTVDVLTIDENSPMAATIGFISTTDIDVTDTHTYTLVSGNGDADNGSFSILTNKLLVNDNFDFESKSSYRLRLRSTDQSGLWVEKAFVVTVNDVNETPTGITAQTVTIAENEPAGTMVATLSATDVDAGESHTYSLVSGNGDADNALFSISGNQVVTTAPLNFEAQSVYSFRVEATDLGGLKYELAVQISVTDANDAPTVATITKYVNNNLRTAQYSVREFNSIFGDEDSDALVSVTISSLPANGTVYLKNTPVQTGTVIDVRELGYLKYIPNGGFIGTDSFTWTAFDGQDNSQPANAIIHVSALRGTGPVANVNWNNLFSAGGQGTQRLDGSTGIEDVQIEDAALTAYPNPFSGQLTVEYSLPMDGTVSMKVFDLSGSLVQLLVEDDQSAGSYSANWNGDRTDGGQIAAGQYILQMIITNKNGEVVVKNQKLTRF